MKDLPEGTTHYENDGCGELAHNKPLPTNCCEKCKFEFRNKCNNPNCSCHTPTNKEGKELAAILKEFDKKFYVYKWPSGQVFSVNPLPDEVESFLTQVYNQAQASEREKIRGVVEALIIPVSKEDIENVRKEFYEGYNGSLTDILNALKE